MRLRIAAALLSTVALAAASVPAADASAHSAAPRVRVTGWTLQTSDHTDDDAVQEPNGASYTMGCDTILEITVKVTAKHVRKNAAFSWRTTYAGATVYHASQTWPASGKISTTFYALKTPSQTGTLVFTMKAKHKVVARGSLHIDVAGCHFA